MPRGHAGSAADAVEIDLYLAFAVGADHMCMAGAIRGGPRPSSFG